MAKPTQEQLAQIELFRKELERGCFGANSFRNQLRATQALRNSALAKYGKYHIATFPDDYPVSIKGKLILNKLDASDPMPFPCLLRDMTPAFSRKVVKKARRKLMNEKDSYEHMVLSDNDWLELIKLETERSNELPMPFYHEALQSFTIHEEDGFEMSFCRSRLPRIRYNDYDIMPMVDCLMKVNSGQPMLLGLGIIDDEFGFYQVAMYWFGSIDKRYHEDVVGALTSYFYAQWAFHVCPERVINVLPGEPDPFENEPTPVPSSQAQPSKKKHSSSRPRRVSIGRKIYVREYPRYTGDGSRKYERHCRCWYVRGYMRTNHKTGKRVWVNGYFKGPDRDDPAARCHIKNYVIE